MVSVMAHGVRRWRIVIGGRGWSSVWSRHGNGDDYDDDDDNVDNDDNDNDDDDDDQAAPADKWTNGKLFATTS